MRLPRKLFSLPTPTVARDLLGAHLIRRLPNGPLLRVRIVETEAYHGIDDTACHARFGQTPRNAVMFGEGGYAYVYLIYGMYDMLNVTANEAGFPGAVLIRAGEPLEGIDAMLELRGGRLKQLTNGPGRLCRALAIDRALNCEDLVQGETLWLEPGEPVPNDAVLRTPRIGINYADPEHRDVHWRFALKGNRWVSK